MKSTPRGLRVVLLGPPGAGKGTQAAQICRLWEVPHISTGDILREHCRQGSELGREAERYMSQGQLVPDSLILDMLRQRLDDPDTVRGFLLDGFPRTTVQAESLEAYLRQVDRPLAKVLQLELDDETIVRRLSRRRTCTRCGRIYHLDENAPRRAGWCDDDDAPLEQRKDDLEAVIRTRLQVYHEQTAPLVTFYAERGVLCAVDSSGSIQEVQRAIARLLADAERPARGANRAPAPRGLPL